MPCIHGTKARHSRGHSTARHSMASCRRIHLTACRLQILYSVHMKLYYFPMDRLASFCKCSLLLEFCEKGHTSGPSWLVSFMRIWAKGITVFFSSCSFMPAREGSAFICNQGSSLSTSMLALLHSLLRLASHHTKTLMAHPSSGFKAPNSMTGKPADSDGSVAQLASFVSISTPAVTSKHPQSGMIHSVPNACNNDDK